MKVSVVLGFVLIVAGSYFLFTGGGFTTRRDVIDVGGLTVTAAEEHPLDPWISTVVLIAGVALVAGGLRRKT